MNINDLNPKQQEAIMELQMLEQKIKQLEAQINAIGKQINEMRGITESLETIDSNNGKETLLPLGKGIFIRTNLGSSNVLLNIGSGVVVEKNAKGTIKLIDEQVKKLTEMAEKYQKEIIDSSRKIEEMISKLQ